MEKVGNEKTIFYDRSWEENQKMTLSEDSSSR
jgi:hypothetical protein